MSSESERDIQRNAARAFAKLCFDCGDEMGPYWIEEAQSYFWAFCADHYMIPRMEKIHGMLVQLGAHERSNGFDFNDLNDRVFYIPVEDAVIPYGLKDAGTYTVRTKVIFHHTQNRDYLWMLNESGNMISETSSTEPVWHSSGKSIHIRRVWQVYHPEHQQYPAMPELLSSAQSILENLCWLQDYTDYPRSSEHDKIWRADRPGLEVYRKAGFRLPNTAQPFSQINLYGDFRDHGYILSYQERWKSLGEFGEFMQAERVHRYAAILLNCYLPALEYACSEKLEGRET